MLLQKEKADQLFSAIGVHRLVEDLKLGKAIGSYGLATLSLQVLQKCVIETQWKTAKELIEMVKLVGEQLTNADPTETVTGNMVLRLLKIIREDYAEAAGQQAGVHVEESLDKMMTTDEDRVEDYGKELPALKDSITNSISELMSELETSGESIAAKSLEHIYSNEVVMTLGKSKTVEAFLKHAAKSKRQFQVIVAECAPFYNGHEIAISLAEAGINTVCVIPDSAIFAIMSRVNKVIIGTHSVMANGGLKALSGAYSLALAAKYYSVPVIVCSAMFKFTPQYLISHDQVAFNKFASPQQVMSFEKGQVVENCEIMNPVFDYVPPELITIFISNTSGNAPSYVYRLLSELYHRKDYLPS